MGLTEPVPSAFPERLVVPPVAVAVFAVPARLTRSDEQVSMGGWMNPAHQLLAVAARQTLIGALLGRPDRHRNVEERHATTASASSSSTGSPHDQRGWPAHFEPSPFHDMGKITVRHGARSNHSK